MTILEEINRKIIEEYKSGNSELRVLLQTVKAELQTKSKDLKRDLTPDEEVSLIRKEVKQRQEALKLYKEGNRNDLVNKMDQEVLALGKFLPPELTDKQIEDTISEILSQTEDKSFGGIMKLAMIKFNGQADGSRIALIVRKLTQS